MFIGKKSKKKRIKIKINYMEIEKFFVKFNMQTQDNYFNLKGYDI